MTNSNLTTKFKQKLWLAHKNKTKKGIVVVRSNNSQAYFAPEDKQNKLSWITKKWKKEFNCQAKWEKEQLRLFVGKKTR